MKRIRHRNTSFVGCGPPHKKKFKRNNLGPGYPAVRSNYFIAYHTEVKIPGSKKKGSAPLGSFGENGKFSFHSRFKGSTGKFKVNKTPVSVIISDLLGTIPKDFIQTVGSPGEAFMIEGGGLTSAEEFLAFYNHKYKYKIKNSAFELLGEHAHHFNRLRLPYVPISPSKEEVGGVMFTADTAAGVVASQVLQRYRKSHTPLSSGRYLKGSFIASAAQAVYDEGDNIHSGKYNDTSGIYSVGGRSKGKFIRLERDNLVSDTKLSSRPVHVPDLFGVVLDSVYYQSFNRLWNSKSKEQSDIGLGHSMYKLGFLRLINTDLGRYNFELEADWSGFDKSVNPTLIRRAFSIIRACYPKGDKIDNAFVMMCNNFIHRDLFTPDGCVYQMSGGIPSGNVGTSIVGSLVNGLAGQECLHNCEGFEKFVKGEYRINVCGDDTRVDSEIEITSKMGEQLIEYAELNLGMKLKSGYISNTIYESNPQKRAGFLKTVVVDFNPIRKTLDLGEKLITGMELTTSSRSDGEYSFSRLTNLFLPKGKDRDRVVTFFATTLVLSEMDSKLVDTVKLKAVQWMLDGNSDYKTVVRFFESISGDACYSFSKWSDFFSTSLDAWYDKLNWSWKVDESLNYWEMGKLRYPVSTWISNGLFSFSGNSGLYAQCYFYGLVIGSTVDPPMG